MAPSWLNVCRADQSCTLFFPLDLCMGGGACPGCSESSSSDLHSTVVSRGIFSPSRRRLADWNRRRLRCRASLRIKMLRMALDARNYNLCSASYFCIKDWNAGQHHQLPFSNAALDLPPSLPSCYLRTSSATSGRRSEWHMAFDLDVRDPVHLAWRWSSSWEF